MPKAQAENRKTKDGVGVAACSDEGIIRVKDPIILQPIESRYPANTLQVDQRPVNTRDQQAKQWNICTAHVQVVLG